MVFSEFRRRFDVLTPHLTKKHGRHYIVTDEKRVSIVGWSEAPQHSTACKREQKEFTFDVGRHILHFIKPTNEPVKCVFCSTILTQFFLV